MIVLIDGQPASGKGVLRGMLDGHPEVFSCPFHDIMPLAFTGPSLNKTALRAKDTEWLRTHLAQHSRYYRIERIANQKVFPFDIGAGTIYNFPVNLDFYSFDKKFFSRLNYLNLWTPQNIIEGCYEILNAEIFGDSAKSKNIFATLGNGEVKAPGRFLERYSDAKVIHLHRDTLSIVGALCRRPPQPGNYRTFKNEHNKIFKEKIRSGIIKDIKKKKLEIANLASKYPDRVLSLSFDEVFESFNDVKRKISRFLDIKEADSMDYFTFIENFLPLSDGQSYFDKPIDDPKDILSEREIDLINFLDAPSVGKFLKILKSPKLILLVLESFAKRGERALKALILKR